MNINQFFMYGLDRHLPWLEEPPEGPQLNLGPGDKKVVPNTYGVGGGQLSDYPDWWAPNPLPAEDGTIAAIHCYQFIEHFDWLEIQLMLHDWSRVLMPGGVVYIVTPHASSSMSWQALDHKTHWNEEVWDWLFDNEYYTPGPELKLKVHVCFLMGIVIRNLNLFTQLIKKD